MRLSDLLHTHVVDADGNNLGSVDDVRLVQDGPLLGGFGAALRIEGLVIGHRSAIGIRLGFHRANTKGPLLLKRLFGLLERRGHYVHWEDVESVDGDVVRIRRRREELDAPPEG